MSDKMRKRFLRVLTGCVTVFLLFSNVTASAQTVPISEDDWALWETTGQAIAFEGEIDPGAAASDKEHGRPAPFAAAPSYCFTPAERAGEPPSTASANQASPPRAGPNLLASLCGARAERRRAHVLSLPESRGTGTGLKPGRESADLTSQGGCLSPAQSSGLVGLRNRGVTGAGWLQRCAFCAVPLWGLIFLVLLYY